jgi:SAM-dependent methyltransferase
VPHAKQTRAPLTARTADKYELYQHSVQDAKIEIDFVDKAFRRYRERLPRSLREDFCGTALLCSEWVARSPERTAVGLDLDPKVLAWGTRHNLRPMGDAANRVRLVRQDVRGPLQGSFDAVMAFNFSYWVFTTRRDMRRYFERVRSALGREGMFFIDVYGGWEAQEPMIDRRKIKRRFHYEWQQESFDPITHRVVNHIHFEFPDGSRMERAFTYDWRYWTIPELRELLEEAGFSRVIVYWDRSDSDDYEHYRPTNNATNHPGWLAYLAALR